MAHSLATSSPGRSAYAEVMTDPGTTQPDAEAKGWCVCGQKVLIADAQAVTLTNGRPGWQGYCPECGSPLFAIRRPAPPAD
jgi:hypothetical protein